MKTFVAFTLYMLPLCILYNYGIFIDQKMEISEIIQITRWIKMSETTWGIKPGIK